MVACQVSVGVGEGVVVLVHLLRDVHVWSCALKGLTTVAQDDPSCM